MNAITLEFKYNSYKLETETTKFIDNAVLEYNKAMGVSEEKMIIEFFLTIQNSATELKKDPLIGVKRAQKIVDYLVETHSISRDFIVIRIDKDLLYGMSDRMKKPGCIDMKMQFRL